MPLTFTERIGMLLRKTPANEIISAYEEALAGGLTISAAQLEAHYISSGNPKKVVAAAVIANQNGLPINFTDVTTLDLTGHDPVTVVEGSLKSIGYSFDTFTPDLPDRIIGFTRDGKAIGGSCTVMYKPPISRVWGWTPKLMHMHLSAHLALVINTADDLRSLKMHQSGIELRLLVIAKGLLDSTESVQVTWAESSTGR